jgi:hypothetical protein
LSFTIKNNWFITLSAFSIALGITLGTGSLYRFAYSYNMIMAATLFIMFAVILYQQFIPIISNDSNLTDTLDQTFSIPVIIIISFMIFFPLFSDIINLISSYEIIYFYIAILLLSMLLKRDFRRKILNAYLTIIVILSIISILTIYLAIFTEYLTFFPHIRITRPLISDFYFFSSLSPSSIWLRNQSIFWEPGAFGFHLIFATLLAYKSRNKFFITILILTCLTTFSTTVFIFLVLLGIYHIFFGKERLKMFIIIFSILTLSLTVIFLITDDLFIPKLIIQALYHKFLPTSSTYSSFVGRTLFTVEAFKMFLDNFIIGAGHYATHMKLEVVTSRATENTSGLAGLLAEFGLFGVFCIFLYTKYFWRFSIIAIPITLIWLNGEFLQYSPLALFILADSAEEFAQELFPLKLKSHIKQD